jgi:putative phage-type endonuclease
MSDDDTTNDTPPPVDTLDKAKWLESRKAGIGASEAAAIFGLSPYTTPLQLYLEKTEQLAPSEGELEYLRWGKYLEGPLVQAFREKTGRIATKEPAFAVRRRPNHEFMCATLDATQEPTPLGVPTPHTGPGVLELKNAGAWTIKEWKEEPPLAFLIQVQHQLAVTGWSYGSIAALVGGNRFVWQDVERSDEFIEILIKKEQEFWERIKERRPPDPDGDHETRKLIWRAYPKATGDLIRLDDPIWIETDDRIVALDKDVTKKSEELEALKNKFRLAIGEASAAALRNGVVYTLRTINKKEYRVGPQSYRELRRKGPRWE